MTVEKEKINSHFSNTEDFELDKFTNQMIVKMTNNLENFNYNVIVANMHETYNFLIKKIENNIDSIKLLKNYKIILTMFSPVIPHFTSECLSDFEQKNLSWPTVDGSLVDDERINYVIQINGKKRDLVNFSKDTSQEDLLNQIKTNKIVDKFLKNKNIKKVIFVKNRLINIILNEK